MTPPGHSSSLRAESERFNLRRFEYHHRQTGSKCDGSDQRLTTSRCLQLTERKKERENERKRNLAVSSWKEIKERQTLREAALQRNWRRQEVKVRRCRWHAAARLDLGNPPPAHDKLIGRAARHRVQSPQSASFSCSALWLRGFERHRMGKETDKRCH